MAKHKPAPPAPRLRRASKSTSFNVPQDAAEADHYVRRIGELRRRQEALETAMNERLAKAKAAFEDRAADVKSELADLEKGVQAWAEANRRTLTDNYKSKTIKLPAGKLSWRIGPVKLKPISKKALPGIIEALKCAGLGKFLRVKEELNRDAMVADEARGELCEIDGIGFKQDEFFDIAPFGARIEGTRDA